MYGWFLLTLWPRTENNATVRNNSNLQMNAYICISMYHFHKWDFYQFNIPILYPLAVLFGLLKRIYKRNLENKIEKLQRWCVYHQFKLKHRADKKRILERKESKTEHCSTPTFFSFSSSKNAGSFLVEALGTPAPKQRSL